MQREARLIREIAKDYQQTFNGEGAPQRVLEDLALLCQQYSTTLPDQSLPMGLGAVVQGIMMEGRRQMYLKIQEYLRFDLGETEVAEQAIME